MWMHSVAWAQASGGSGSASGTLLSLVPFILIFVIFYFMLILPQQKKQKQQKAMMDALKKGDKVITASDGDQSGERHGDAADRRQYENQDAAGAYCPAALGGGRQRCIGRGRRAPTGGR